MTMTLRQRSEVLGLSAPILADVLRVDPSNARRALDAESAAVRAVITAWEIMTPEQRLHWLAELGVSAERPRRGRPRKVQS